MSLQDDDWNVGTSIDFDTPATTAVTLPVIKVETSVSSEDSADGSSVDGSSVDVLPSVSNVSSVGSNGVESKTRGAMAWTSLKKVFSKKKVSEDSTESNKVNWDSLEGADAELCILYFQRGLNYRGLKNRLKSADQEWIADFLDRDGLAVIFNALSGLGKRGISSMTEAIDQLHCVAAVKEVMNRPVGLEYMVEGAGREQMGSLMTGELCYTHDVVPCLFIV